MPDSTNTLKLFTAMSTFQSPKTTGITKSSSIEAMSDATTVSQKSFSTHSSGSEKTTNIPLATTEEYSSKEPSDCKI